MKASTVYRVALLAGFPWCVAAQGSLPLTGSGMTMPSPDSRPVVRQVPSAAPAIAPVPAAAAPARILINPPSLPTMAAPVAPVASPSTMAVPAPIAPAPVAPQQAVAPMAPVQAIRAVRPPAPPATLVPSAPGQAAPAPAAPVPQAPAPQAAVPASPAPAAQNPAVGQNPVAAPPSPARLRQGDTTRQLLAAQAAGTMAGPPRPMVGAAATLSWQRYLDSFTHAIPEWFEEKVEDGGSE